MSMAMKRRRVQNESESSESETIPVVNVMAHLKMILGEKFGSNISNVSFGTINVPEFV